MVRRKIVDVEKFKEMYVSGVPAEEIADYFGVAKLTVYSKASILGLKRKRGRGPHPVWLIKKYKRAALENEEKVIVFLRKVGGFCELNELRSNVPKLAMKRLFFKRRIFRVTFCLGYLAGSYKRWMGEKIFKPEYHGKTYICLGRTGVVRLMMQALILPENRYERKTLVTFLKRYLTEAEWIAVMFKLGDKKWRGDRIRGNIRVDGLYVPRVFNLSRDERLRLKYPFEAWCWKTQRQVRVNGEIRHFSAQGLQVLKIHSCIHKASCGSADTTECLIGKELQGVWIRQEVKLPETARWNGGLLARKPSRSVSPSVESREKAGK